MVRIDLHLYNADQVPASYPISSIDLASTLMLTLTQTLGVARVLQIILCKYYSSYCHFTYFRFEEQEDDSSEVQYDDRKKEEKEEDDEDRDISSEV